MITVIGIDPGPNTGICVVTFARIQDWTDFHPRWFQCDGKSAPLLCSWIEGSIEAYTRTYIQIEEFIPGNGAGSKGENAQLTRELSHKLGSFFPYADVKLVHAAEVKAWATDKRLEAAGFKYPYAGTAMRHANDAARHALYRTRRLGWKDPLG